MLLDHNTMGFNAYRSVGEWLESLKMGQYADNFNESGYTSLDVVTKITLE